MPINRRDLLKAIAATSLTACGNDSTLLSNPGTGPGTPTGPNENTGVAEFTDSLPAPGSEPASFDFPMVLALPFAHGVASGDPLADRVMLWTRLTFLAPPADGVKVRWAISTNPDLSNPVKTGSQVVLAARDWTLKVDVSGLNAATTYYYQFYTGPHRSVIGRTRTAPASTVDAISLAVVSCASYWSSTWSGYGAIARRDDLDLVIHCGDYIYDFVDEDERIRARKDKATTDYVDYRDWLNLDECRRRYALFRSDPNLMEAHRQHPWFITWDNHDIDPGFGNELPTTLPDGVKSTCTLADTTQAFWEWTPSRPVKADGSGEFLLYPDTEYPEPEDALKVYRTLPYGPLASIRALDTQLALPRYGQTVDASHLEDSAPSLMGKRQFDWLVTGLRQDQARGVVWKILNNQTWIAPWVVPNLSGSPVARLPVRWSDYSEERTALVQQLRGQVSGTSAAQAPIQGCVFVSGDMHGNWAADVVEDNATAYLAQGPVGVPVLSTRPGTSSENRAAGVQRLNSGNLPGVNLRAASAAVEFAPSSMGRGGADELVANAAPVTPFALQVAASRAVETATLLANRHVQFMEWVEHGYGVVVLTAEKAVFECWWQDKTRVDAPDVLGAQLVSFANDAPSALPVPRFANQIDTVQVHGMTVNPVRSPRTSVLAPSTASVLPR
ncbi:MAG: alkaline phosphatase D family protein [Limnobacter sp.]|uniref:alkaline phosphatase D family protein n=1 Tax=Limnobacter sp. TaxID=2003368 RepID=UPI00391BAC90